jgi:Pentapeptide repeats (8 copies)
VLALTRGLTHQVDTVTAWAFTDSYRGNGPEGRPSTQCVYARITPWKLPSTSQQVITTRRTQLRTNIWRKASTVMAAANISATAAANISAPAAALLGVLIGSSATFLAGLLQYRQLGKQLTLVRSGQVTDRFTKAVEQLGSNNPQVRMGGVYALERIAHDSERDQSAVAAMLAALVRFHSHDTWLSEGVPLLKIRAPDVQAALTVLSRKPVCKDHVESNEPGRLDLSETDLRRAILPNAQLQGADLSKARLEGANLRGAHLEGANLTGVNVGRFDPTSTRYQFGTDLSGAYLTGAKMDYVDNKHEAVTVDAIGLPEDW